MAWAVPVKQVYQLDQDVDANSVTLSYWMVDNSRSRFHSSSEELRLRFPDSSTLDKFSAAIKQRRRKVVDAELRFVSGYVGQALKF